MVSPSRTRRYLGFESGPNCCQADGDGLYDVRLDFRRRTQHDRFVANETVVFDMSRNAGGLDLGDGECPRRSRVAAMGRSSRRRICNPSRVIPMGTAHGSRPMHRVRRVAVMIPRSPRSRVRSSCWALACWPRHGPGVETAAAFCRLFGGTGRNLRPDRGRLFLRHSPEAALRRVIACSRRTPR